VDGRVLQVVQVQMDRILSEFESLVRIDSLSLRERQMADFLKSKLSELGCDVEEDDGAKTCGGTAGNVIARFPGTDPSLSPILLSAHMDRVAPGEGIIPVRDGNTIRSSGDTILGADDAAGVAAILEVLRLLRENGGTYPDVEVVFSFSEEVGLLGAKALDIGKLRSKVGYVIDSGAPISKVIVQSPSHVTFNVKIKGKAAHAGVEPEKGIDAVQVAARAITQMRLGRIDDETTANLGMIRGGHATNIVCDLVQIRGEVRSLNRQKLDDNVAAIEQAFRESCDAAGATLEFSPEVEYETYCISPTSEVCKRLQAAAEKLGISLKFASAGGGSDANIYNARGIECVVLSGGYAKPHTLEETLYIDELEQVVSLVYEAVRV
jgi:tripeptide aminopeptidase